MNIIEPNQVEKIQFNEDTIDCIQYNNKVYVVLKRICDNLALGWDAQYKRIKRDYILSKVIIQPIFRFGITQAPVTCLEIKYVNGFLFGIDDSRIEDPIVQKRVREYKEKCYTVLYEYFNNANKQPEPQYNVDITRVLSICERAVTAMEQTTTTLMSEMGRFFNIYEFRLKSLEESNQAIKANTYQLTAATNQIISKNTSPYYSAKELRADPIIGAKVTKYSSRKGYIKFIQDLMIFAQTRGSAVIKRGGLNTYNYQIVKDFFDPRFNPEIVHIIKNNP